MIEQYYIVVKSSVHSSDTAVFNLTQNELSAITKRHGVSDREVINGVLVKANPLLVINSLSELGYRVVCSSGEGEVVWTLTRGVVVDDDGDLWSGSAFPLSRSCSFEDSSFDDSIDFQAVKSIKKVKPSSGMGGTAEEKLNDKERSDSQIVLLDPRQVVEHGVPLNARKFILKAKWSSEDNPLSLRNRGGMQGACQCLNSNRPPCLVTRCGNMERHCCQHDTAVPSVHQTLDEMDFERGLWYAAMTGDMERVRRLLEKGHCPNGLDSSGYSALHYAARCGHTAVCALLLEAGAYVSATTRAGGSTPLHRAALAGREDTVKLLLSYGADSLAVDADGRTPLHRAMEGRSPGVITALFQACQPAATVQDRYGNTPASMAAADPLLGRLFVP